MAKKFYDIIPLQDKTIQDKTIFKNPSLKTPTAKGAVFFLILLVLVVGVFGLFFFAKIEIEIWPTTELLTLEKEITIDSKAEKSDFEKGIFLAKVFETQKSASREFPATGKFLKKEKARGILTVYNGYSVSPLSLIPSRFISADGKLFWSTKTITIPGATYEKGKLIPGKLEVEVQAAEPGEEYNIEPSTFALPALAGSPLYTAVYAKSFSPMVGGFIGQVSQVTKEDLEKAKNILVEEAENKGKEFLKETLPEDFVLMEQTISQQILEAKSSIEVGVEAESFNEQVKVKLEGLGFKKSELDEFVREIISLNIKEGEKFQEKSLEVNYSLLNLPSTTFLEKVVLGLEIKTKVYSDIDEEGLKKALLGKSLKETKLFLDNLKGIERIEVKSWPFFSKKIPEDINKVKIRLNID